MTSIGGIRWCPRLGSEKSHYVHGWIVVCQKPNVLGRQFYTDCPRLESITGESVGGTFTWGGRLWVGLCDIMFVCNLKVLEHQDLDHVGHTEDRHRPRTLWFVQVDPWCGEGRSPCSSEGWVCRCKRNITPVACCDKKCFGNTMINNRRLKATLKII